MRDDPRLFDAFDDCLARLAAGESVEGCLASYPDLAADLAPMLDAARFAEAAAPVPHHAQMRSRARSHRCMSFWTHRNVSSVSIYRRFATTPSVS